MRFTSQQLPPRLAALKIASDHNCSYKNARMSRRSVSAAMHLELQASTITISNALFTDDFSEHWTSRSCTRVCAHGCAHATHNRLHTIIYCSQHLQFISHRTCLIKMSALIAQRRSCLPAAAASSTRFLHSIPFTLR